MVLPSGDSLIYITKGMVIQMRGNRSAGGGSRTHTHREVNWILSPARYVVLYHIKYSLTCYNLDSLLPLINEESGENLL